MMRRSRRAALTAIAALMACTNAGEKLTSATLPNGAVPVTVYFDRDDSHSFTSLDTAFAGVRLTLLAPGGTDTLRSLTTDGLGRGLFDTLPVGTYHVIVDRHALGDSVGTVAGDTTFRVTVDSLHPALLIRLGYTEVNLRQARALPPGQRVAVRAIVTSPLQAFRDSTAFLVDSSGTLRITGARPRVGNGNNIGDSVVVFGTSGASLGQNVLTNGLFAGTITAGVAPLPTIVSVVDANSAQGGALDAAFVQITSFVIRDTVAQGTDFVVHIVDPADTSVKTTVLIDQLLSLPHSAFFPGRTGTVRGVLVPVGDGTWVLKPRSGFDITLN
jgi:hypothetical protein